MNSEECIADPALLQGVGDGDGGILGGVNASGNPRRTVAEPRVNYDRDWVGFREAVVLSLHLLCVEDYADFLQMLSRILQNDGYRVTTGSL